MLLKASGGLFLKHKATNNKKKQLCGSLGGEMLLIVFEKSPLLLGFMKMFV